MFGKNAVICSALKMKNAMERNDCEFAIWQLERGRTYHCAFVGNAQV